MQEFKEGSLEKAVQLHFIYDTSRAKNEGREPDAEVHVTSDGKFFRDHAKASAHGSGLINKSVRTYNRQTFVEDVVSEQTTGAPKAATAADLREQAEKLVKQAEKMEGAAEADKKAAAEAAKAKAAADKAAKKAATNKPTPNPSQEGNNGGSAPGGDGSDVGPKTE